MKKKPAEISMTQMLIQRFGEQELYKIWCEQNGMYGAAKYLTKRLGCPVSGPVVRYLSYKFNWVREINDPSIIFVKGILQGTIPASYYKHIRINIPGPAGKEENGDKLLSHRERDELEEEIDDGLY